LAKGNTITKGVQDGNHQKGGEGPLVFWGKSTAEKKWKKKTSRAMIESPFLKKN